MNRDRQPAAEALSAERQLHWGRPRSSARPPSPGWEHERRTDSRLSGGLPADPQERRPSRLPVLSPQTLSSPAKFLLHSPIVPVFTLGYRRRHLRALEKPENYCNDFSISSPKIEPKCSKCPLQHIRYPQSADFAMTILLQNLYIVVIPSFHIL